jgi:hypothetical protein
MASEEQSVISSVSNVSRPENGLALRGCLRRAGEVPFSNRNRITHGFCAAARGKRFETVLHVRSGQIVSKYFLTGLVKRKTGMNLASKSEIPEPRHQ